MTTNSVEGYFSIFKRGMRGVYQHCAEKHLHRYLATGLRSPGVLLIRPGFGLPQIANYLVLVAYSSEAVEWENRLTYIPQ